VCLSCPAPPIHQASFRQWQVERSVPQLEEAAAAAAAARDAVVVEQEDEVRRQQQQQQALMSPLADSPSTASG